MEKIDVDKLYQEVEKYLLAGIESEYVEELKSNYKKHLYDLYDEFEFQEEKIDQAMANSLKLQIFSLKDSHPKHRLSRFIKDEARRNVEQLSSQAFRLAKQRVYEGRFSITPEEVIKKKEELLEQLDQVKYFNQSRCRVLVSEAMLDLTYASKEMDIASMRISTYIREVKRRNG